MRLIRAVFALLCLPLAGCSMFVTEPPVLPAAGRTLEPAQVAAVKAVVVEGLQGAAGLDFGTMAVGRPRSYGQNGKPAAPICGVVQHGAARAIFLVWYNNDAKYVLAGVSEAGQERAAILGQCLSLGATINPNAPLHPPNAAG